MKNKEKGISSKKRIFLITPFENGLAKRGTRFIDIAEILHNDGWEVNYYTTNFSHAYKHKFSEVDIKKEKKKRDYNLNFVPIIGYSKNISISRIFSNFKMSYDFYKILNTEIKENDYVLVPSRPVDFISFISKLKNKKRNIKLVLDIRDTWPDAFVKKNILFNFYCNFFLKNSIKKYDLFFHISPSFTNWLNRYAPKAHSEFIPPGFNSERFPDFKPLIKNGNTKKIVFIGALQYQLDILPLIKAIANNTNYELTIIGENGNGQRYNECNTYIVENGVNNVTVKGVIEPDKVSKELANYDIGVIPMISNSITNKLFDYVASYLPILVLGNNDSSKLVLENKIGWTVDFNSDEIESLLSTITWDEINEKIRNVEKIRTKYDRNNLYKKIPKLISTLG